MEEWGGVTFGVTLDTQSSSIIWDGRIFSFRITY
jgi:hypothetical protein